MRITLCSTLVHSLLLQPLYSFLPQQITLVPFHQPGPLKHQVTQSLIHTLNVLHFLFLLRLLRHQQDLVVLHQPLQGPFLPRAKCCQVMTKHQLKLSIYPLLGVAVVGPVLLNEGLPSLLRNIKSIAFQLSQVPNLLFIYILTDVCDFILSCYQRTQFYDLSRCPGEVVRLHLLISPLLQFVFFQQLATVVVLFIYYVSLNELLNSY